jgi:hypothetical protein
MEPDVPPPPLMERHRFCVSRLYQVAEGVFLIWVAGAGVVLAFRNALTLLLIVPALGWVLWVAWRTAWCVEVSGGRVQWENPVAKGQAGIAQVMELKLAPWNRGGGREFRLVISGGRSPFLAAFPRGAFDDWVATLEHRLGRYIRSD